jgi:hypothetical protein
MNMPMIYVRNIICTTEVGKHFIGLNFWDYVLPTNLTKPKSTKHVNNAFFEQI